MRKTIILLILILTIPSILALDYIVDVNSPTHINVYEGETNIENFVSAVITNNGDYCDITCSYTTSFNTHSNEELEVAKAGGKGTFKIKVDAEGIKGIASYILTITCERKVNYINCWPSSDSNASQNSFTFLWNGDGVCTTDNEKCIAYGGFLYDSSCDCSSDKECRPDSSREIDSKGCATYCGNGIAETTYETCSNCPKDVGKCNLKDCISGSECEGKYCIHEFCWDKPWREEDNFCDVSEGENCKNSNDCVCNNDELCSNGICEKIKSSEDEINQAVKKGVQDTLKTSENRQKIISYVSMGLIILVLLGYILFKRIKLDRSKSKSTKKTTKKKK
ncbi:hypothetical protein KAJ87_03105 [Candidatus Pacearchaeota archaeon]|nr:hypothetical protein [Candidatus Pacearchaeota archaeon]